MAKIIEQLVARYGMHSNSFLALYSGYHYFHLNDPNLGCIAYIRTKQAWVGVAEPLASPDNQLVLLNAFTREAKMDGKAAVLLPVSDDFRKRALGEGFASVQIGSEPYFNLDYYPVTGKGWLDVSHSAKALRVKKFVVRKFDFATCSRAVRLELTQIQQEWLQSRKIGELGFVNRVEPEFLSQLKVHFYLEGSGRIFAFLSAIPMNHGKSWYFIDVIRRRDAHAGSVELLMLEAMRLLKEEGAKSISLGVAPLALIAQHGERIPSALEKMMKYFFDHFQWFYSFRSLFDFKNKFHPSEWKPAYAIHNFDRSDHRLLAVLTECFVPQGPLSVIGQMLQKRLNLRLLVHQIKGWMTETVILRANPTNLQSTLLRSPFSSFLLLSFISIFIGTFEPGLLLSRYWVKNGAFSFINMESIDSFSRAVEVLIIPAFLHWNLPHLLFNVFTFILLGISLEIFLGSRFFLLSYFGAVLFANPVAVVLIAFLARIFPVSILQGSLSSLDVGASLGIWSCAGAWSFFLKNRTSAWILFVFTVAAIAYLKGDLLQVNHIVAAFFGYLVARFCFKGIHIIPLRKAIS